jgi:hypothetical protein
MEVGTIPPPPDFQHQFLERRLKPMSSDHIYSTTISTKSSTIFSMKSRLITTAAKDDRLQHAALKMLTLLVFEYYNTKTGQCNPGDHLLMKSLQVHERTIDRVRTQLKELGYVSLGQSNNTYIIN